MGASGGRAGVAIITAVLLSLAAVLLAHGLFLLARFEYEAAAAGRDLLVAQVAAEEALWGLRRSAPLGLETVEVGGRTAALASEPVVGGVIPPGSGALRASAVSARALLQRLGREVWLIEGDGRSGVAMDRRSLPVWIVDPRARSAGFQVNPTVSGSGAPLGPLTVDSLLARVGVVLDSVGTPRPVERLGACIEEDPWNWGDPGAPAGACSDLFRVHGAVDGLRAEGGRGQGLLLVRGGLTLMDIEFHGLIIATGEVSLLGATDVWGGIISGADIVLGGEASVRGDSSLVLW
jgi:hypothetical protein